MPSPPASVHPPILCLASDDVGLAPAAERAGFDMVLAGHGPPAAGRLDPLSLAVAATTTTGAIGLAAAVPTAGWAPFNLARAFASFDRLCGGRAAWLASAGEDSGPDPGYARFAEYLEVVFDLFDSWDDQALVLDKAGSVFADATKVRRIAHHGAAFTVDGPLNAPRPIQGRPVILQAIVAGAPPVRWADIAVCRAGDVEAAAADRARTTAPRMIVELAVGLDSRAAAAEWTDRIAAWLSAGACDGFLITLADPAADLPALAERVIPALRDRGLARPGATAGDLRARLGLARPANRLAPR